MNAEDRRTRLMVAAVIVVMIAHHRATKAGWNIPELDIPQYCHDVQDCGWITTTTNQ